MLNIEDLSRLCCIKVLRSQRSDWVALLCCRLEQVCNKGDFIQNYWFIVCEMTFLDGAVCLDAFQWLCQVIFVQARFGANGSTQSGSSAA